MEFLPDLMTMLDGTPVSHPDQWEKRRRELIDILRKNIFGYAPATLSPGRGEILEVDQKCCAGHAEMETVKITVDTKKGPFSFPMLYFRNTMQEKSPLFLLVNFRPEAYDRYFPIEEIVDNGFSLAMIYYKDKLEKVLVQMTAIGKMAWPLALPGPRTARALARSPYGPGQPVVPWIICSPGPKWTQIMWR